MHEPHISSTHGSDRVQYARGLRGVTRRRIVPRLLVVVGVIGGWLAPLNADPGLAGFPLTRIYPFEAIGDVTPGASLAFDAFGRLLVVQENGFAALNDGLWVDDAEPGIHDIALAGIQTDTDGTSYYGALGSWGVLAPGASGKPTPMALSPAERPRWVAATTFNQLLCLPDAVCFAGWNGVAHWDRATRVHRFFEVPALARVFSFEGQLYVASHLKGMLTLDAARGELREADRSVFHDVVVAGFAAFDAHRALVATSGQELRLFHDGGLHPLPPPLHGRLPGAVAAVQRLDNGNVAVAVTGDGLLIVTREGQVQAHWRGAEYSRIMALASNEPGILWAVTETGVLKVFHDHPFTVVGQSLGLPVEWPQLVPWNGQLIISSAGRLYEPVATPPPEPTRFRRVDWQPESGVWGIATAGRSLLVGNSEGIYVREPDSDFRRVAAGLDGTRLVVLDTSTCLVVGIDEIGALQLRDGVWSECVPRIRGLGFAPIVHAGRNAAWLELGVNRVARVALRRDRLEARLFEDFSWPQPSWVNVSVLGETVVLTGPDRHRLFFDEERETFTDAPAVREVFEASPHAIQRISVDDTGTFWGSYDHGILSIVRHSGGYTVDTSSYDLLNVRSPNVHALPEGDVWVSTGQSLYHLDRTRRRGAPPFAPVLVSARDTRTGVELLERGGRDGHSGAVRCDQNSVTLTFFAGSYAARHTPAYEFRLDDAPWRAATSGSNVALSDLSPGEHRLSVRLVDSRGPIGATRDFPVWVATPWHRRWYVVLAAVLFGAGAMYGLVRFAVRRAEARNAALEALVGERTRQLQQTMEKLQQETQTSATLAERNRLAGEIHDSLEQGFTGLTLQLETTAGFARCPPEVKSGLTVALNMVAFSRNEVRHAVRNLHSPALDHADLATALRQIVAQLAPAAGFATVTTQGPPRPLASTVEHHLLRIAQEAVTNVVKHAAARRLEVVLTFLPGEVRLSIQDDGRGFDPALVLQDGSGRFGLPSFRGRARKLGGTVQIVSRPGAGCHITVCVPA